MSAVKDAMQAGWAQASGLSSQFCYVLGCNEPIQRDGDDEPREFKHRHFGWVSSCERHDPERT